MDRKIVAGLSALGITLCGWSGAKAATIHLDGAIVDATLRSGLTGSLTPTFVTDRYQAAIDIENGAVASFSITLPELTFSFGNCGQPDSYCGNSIPSREAMVQPDGSPYFMQQYVDLGSFATFSVYLPQFGTATGYFDKDGSAGQLDVNLLILGIGRADNAGSLQARLSVQPVPVPASFPMFGGALIALGALAWRRNLKGAITKRRSPEPNPV